MNYIARAPIGAFVDPGARLRIKIIAAAVIAPDAGLRGKRVIQFYLVVLAAEFRTIISCVSAVAGYVKFQHGKLRIGGHLQGSAVHFGFYCCTVAIIEASIPEAGNFYYVARRRTFNKGEFDVRSKPTRIAAVMDPDRRVTF